jgi:hypothetical protein
MSDVHAEEFVVGGAGAGEGEDFEDFSSGCVEAADEDPFEGFFVVVGVGVEAGFVGDVEDFYDEGWDEGDALDGEGDADVEDGGEEEDVPPKSEVDECVGEDGEEEWWEEGYVEDEEEDEWEKEDVDRKRGFWWWWGVWHSLVWWNLGVWI